MNKLPELKPLFLERMKLLLSDKQDFDKYLEVLKQEPANSIRCNTLKIDHNELKKILEDKGWKIKQPFEENPEIIIVESNLHPGELGRVIEHLLGYYYIQEISSMLPVISLKPQQDDFILDLCASPGSKTTQIASMMKNTGTIIANELDFERIKVLSANLERCGVTNAITTKREGVSLCKKLKENNFIFDKILVDAPCSGEGIIRNSPKTILTWNINNTKRFSALQKELLASAIEILGINGEIVYSTCTHAPEENEEVVDFILKKFKGKIRLEKIKLPNEIETRPGITNWGEEKYLEQIKLCCRIYPQDNNTEGFFLAKFRRAK